MRWEDQGSSNNVEDRRGGFGGFGGGFGGRGFGGLPIPMGGGGFSITTLIIIGVIMWMLGIDPRALLDGDFSGGGSGTSYEDRMQPADKNDTQVKFVSAVLATTERAWGSYFTEMGSTYEQPKLVLFSNAISSACGFAQSATGPFYCPNDHKVYLDMAFFRELERRFGAPGDFARAYVIGHEIGHHVQNQLGILERVQGLQQRGGRKQANAVQVRVELQADCLAGVWAKRADETQAVLEPGDVEEALQAASAIGDDRLQKQTQGHVVPESFTHGTSAQRVTWFQNGLKSGKIDACDTFSAKTL